MSGTAFSLRNWIKRRSFEENNARTAFTLKINIEGITDGNKKRLLDAASIHSHLDVTSDHIREIIMDELYPYDAVTADRFRWKWYTTKNKDDGIFIKVIGRLVYPDDSFDIMISHMEEVNHDI